MNNQWDKLIKHDPCEISLENINITILDGVFAPHPNLTYSTTQALNFLKTLNLRDKTILDIACGSGIIGIFCLINGAKNVTFSDISQEAITNTHLNLKKNNLEYKSKVIRSDLFENIHEKFDIIIANLPISNELWLSKINQRTETLLEIFLKDSTSFIKKEGKIILNWASFASLQLLIDILDKFKFKYKLLQEKRLDHDWYLIIIYF